MADLIRQIRKLAEREPISTLDVRQDLTPYCDPKFQRCILRGEYPDAPGPGLISHEVQFIIEVLNLRRSSSVLDLCCGDGSHCLELARGGINSSGVDIGELLIKRADKIAAAESLPAKFIASDILRFRSSAKFDAVIILGHSLGMFTEEKIGKVLQKAAAFLKKGGKLLIELESRDAVNMASARPWSVCRHLDHHDLVFHEEHYNPCTARWWVRDYTLCAKTGKVGCIVGSTRVFTVPELRILFADAGMKLTGAYGDWHASPLGTESELMLVTGSKAG